MRLTLTLVAAVLASPLASPAIAADGHDWLNRHRNWTTLGEAPGKAWTAPGGIRQADDRSARDKLQRFGQFLAGGANSDDGLDLRSTMVEPTKDGRRLGVDGLRGVIRDGTDEDALTMEVYKGWQVKEDGRIIGDPVASKTWDYEGKRANGDRQWFNFKDLDARAVAVRFVTGEGPNGLGNGFSWRVNDTTYICPPGEPHRAEKVKSTRTAAVKDRSSKDAAGKSAKDKGKSGKASSRSTGQKGGRRK